MSEENKKDMSQSYDDSSIQVLEALEAVRKRPGMYIGSTDAKGLHHLIWEILDNAVDEVSAGFADEVILTVKNNHIVTITDNGRGIPTGINEKTKTSNLLVVFTSLHAGGKFDNISYKTSGGLHGVGSTCVNALSSFMDVTVWRDGQEHRVSFKDGGKVNKAPYVESDAPEDKHGTSVTWRPDFSIFDEEKYDIDLIQKRMEHLAYLNAGKKFIFINELENKEPKIYLFQEGLKDWIKTLNQGKDALHDIVVIHKEGTANDRKILGKTNPITIDFAFQYNSTGETQFFSFCNNINTELGGTHLEAFKEGLLDCITDKLQEFNRVKDAHFIEKSDVFSSLSAVISIGYSSPEYSGQTKGLLTNVEIKKFIRYWVSHDLHKYMGMDANLEATQKILQRVIDSRMARLQYEKANKRQSKAAKAEALFFAGKLADCSIKNPEFSELYIVEGDSAGGSAKSARDRNFQAILPIKGKLVNVWKTSKLSTLLKENEEVKSLISAIGCGYSYGNSRFNIGKLKYNKIIIMTDADVDGSHIRTLILTFLYKVMYPLVERGHVYVAQPPLFRASNNRENIYLFDEAARDKFIQEHPRNWDIGRFKGLGEMSPEQLWDTTMDPEKRTLLQVHLENIVEEQTRVFDDLMGIDVKPRHDFIMANYHNANIDA